MKNIFKKLVLFNLIAGIFLCLNFAQIACAFTITFDPGHGGDASGCIYEYDGITYKEKDLNYAIVLFAQEMLTNKYVTKNGEEIKVVLTRNEFENPTLSERVMVGVKSNSKAVISFHLNATSAPRDSKRGSMILVTSCKSSPLYIEEEKLAKCFLKQFVKIGLSIQNGGALKNPGTTLIDGLLRKLSDDGSTYSTGETTDWYGIVYHGIKNNIPSIIVEHAYLSNEEDFREFLSTKEKLRKLAKADVKAIAKHYGLVRKNRI